MAKVKLGRRYRDRVTGFEGVAVSRHDYIAGCSRFTLERLADNGEKVVGLTFDEPNLEPVDDVQLVALGRRATGGPHNHGTPGLREE